MDVLLGSVRQPKRRRRLQQQVEGYERDLISTTEKRDDVLQRLEGEGVREVNDWREAVEAFQRDDKVDVLCEIAFVRG
jgi:hypothetical protein